MVRRDLDVTVVCPRLDTAAHERVAALGARLAVHERVRQVRLRNDTGAWNEDPDAYPDGLYLGPSYRSPASHSPCPRKAGTGRSTCGSSTTPPASPTSPTCASCPHG